MTENNLVCLAFPHKMQQAHNTFWRGARRNMVLTPSKQPIHWPMTADLTTASKYKIFIYSRFSLYWSYGLFTLFISFDVQCTWPPILLNDFTAFCDELEETIESHGNRCIFIDFHVKWFISSAANKKFRKLNTRRSRSFL